MLNIALDFSVTAENTLSVNWSKTYKYDVKIKIYPLYELTEGKLWEDDIWEDDELGNFKAYRLVGDEIRVTKT